MRRTPVYDPFDDRDDDLSAETPENVRRIPTTPGYDRVVRRADVRPIRTARRPAPKRGPDPRVWFVRGAIGVAALAGLWLGLQALFPITESQVTQASAPTLVVPADASTVGAPEPPAATASSSTQPAASAPGTEANSAPAQAAAAAPATSQPAVEVAPAVPDRLPGLPQTAPAQPAPAQPVAAAPAAPASQPEGRQENPAQQPAGKPTLAPIPPPPSSNVQPASPAQQAAQQAQQQAAAAAPKPQAPAPAAPPAAQATGGPFELAASASPVNPVSEQAEVTITIKATQNGTPLVGASCMATVYFRTNTIKQPDGGFRTNGNGVGAFTLDARGSTYGHYIPVDVTCSGRGGTVTARTGFTPVRGR